MEEQVSTKNLKIIQAHVVSFLIMDHFCFSRIIFCKSWLYTLGSYYLPSEYFLIFHQNSLQLSSILNMLMPFEVKVSKGLFFVPSLSLLVQCCDVFVDSICLNTLQDSMTCIGVHAISKTPFHLALPERLCRETLLRFLEAL